MLLFSLAGNTAPPTHVILRLENCSFNSFCWFTKMPPSALFSQLLYGTTPSTLALEYWQKPPLSIGKVTSLVPIFESPTPGPPTYAIWSTLPTTNNGGSEIGRPGYIGFYVCYGYEWLCFEFPIKANVFALQLQNTNPCPSNSHPIPHYWWR